MALSRATFKWVVMEKTKIVTVLYKGRLLGLGSHKENSGKLYQGFQTEG